MIRLISFVALTLMIGDSASSDKAMEMPEDHIFVKGMNIQHGRRRLTQGIHTGCPVDDQYDPKCLEAAMPPFPICTKLTTDEWVKKAMGGSYDRCCGEDNDLSECKCPVKTSEKFLNKIGAHCDGLEICKSQVLAMEELLVAPEAASVERMEVVYMNGPHQ